MITLSLLAVSPSNPSPTLSVFLTSAVVAAIVSTLGAIVGHRIARQNAQLAAAIALNNAQLSAALEAAKKLADSRQNWIDLLRQDMADFVALAALRSRARRAEQDLVEVDFERLVATSARISMRMNPQDEDYDALQSSMATCMTSNDAGESGRASRDFVSISQRILKREWDVLKTALLKLDTVAQIGSELEKVG